MAKGHTIPLLHFAHLLLRRGVTVTIFTTPANHPFVSQSLNDTATSIITLPFPDNISPDIPAGTESTDKLPSMSLFYDFAAATVAMQPHFEQALETLPHVTFMVTDAFLWWTLHSATRFSIPRLYFFGMSCYSSCVTGEAMRGGILNGSQPDGELVALTRFPWIKLCKEDFEPSFRNIDPSSLQHDFNVKVFSTMASSYGVLVNSFYELEPTFIDYMNMEVEGSPKSWCVGPFFLAEPTTKSSAEPGM